MQRVLLLPISIHTDGLSDPNIKHFPASEDPASTGGDLTARGGQKKHSPNRTRAAAPREQRISWHSSENPTPPLTQNYRTNRYNEHSERAFKRNNRFGKRRRCCKAERGPSCSGRNAARHNSGTGAGPRQEFPPTAERRGSADRRAAPPGAPRRAREAPLRRHAHLPAAGTARLRSFRSPASGPGRSAGGLSLTPDPGTAARPRRRSQDGCPGPGRQHRAQRGQPPGGTRAGPPPERRRDTASASALPAARAPPRSAPSQPLVVAPPSSRCSATPAVAPPDPAPRALFPRSPSAPLRSARGSAAVRGGGGGSSAPPSAPAAARGGARGAGWDVRGGPAEFRAARCPGAAAGRVDKRVERCAIGGHSGSAGCGAGVGRERCIGGTRAPVGAFSGRQHFVVMSLLFFITEP